MQAFCKSVPKYLLRGTSFQLKSISLEPKNTCLFEYYRVSLLRSGYGAVGSTVGSKLPTNAGDARQVGSIPGSGRSPGGGKGNPFQYSCLENPMDRGAWRATVHEVAKSRT